MKPIVEHWRVPTEDVELILSLKHDATANPPLRVAGTLRLQGESFELASCQATLAEREVTRDDKKLIVRELTCHGRATVGGEEFRVSLERVFEAQAYPSALLEGRLVREGASPMTWEVEVDSALEVVAAWFVERDLGQVPYDVLGIRPRIEGFTTGRELNDEDWEFVNALAEILEISNHLPVPVPAPDIVDQLRRYVRTSGDPVKVRLLSIIEVLHQGLDRLARLDFVRNMVKPAAERALTRRYPNEAWQGLHWLLSVGYYSHEAADRVVNYRRPTGMTNSARDIKVVPTAERRAVLERTDWDVIVVGSGPAGGIIAERLSRSLRVLIIEHGPHQPLSNVSADEPDALARLWMRGGLQFGALRDGRGEGRNFEIAQGNCVGGGARINNAVCFRLPEATHASWVSDGFPITYPELEAAWDALEKELHIGSITRVDSRLNPAVRALSHRYGAPQEPTSTLPQAGLRAVSVNARAAGPDDGPCFGWGLSNLGVNSERKVSVVEKHLPDATAREHCKLVTEVRVTEVLVEGGRARGVQCVIDGKPVFARAEHVVLCAGAIGSSRILHATQAVRDLGLPIGQRFSANLSAPLFAIMKHRWHEDTSAQIAHYLADPENPAAPGWLVETWSNPPGCHSLAMHGFLGEHASRMERYDRTLSFNVQTGSAPTGRVDEEGHVTLVIGEAEIGRVKQGIAATLEAVITHGDFEEAIIGYEGARSVKSLGDLGNALREIRSVKGLALHSSHPQGGNAMSERPGVGVVGRDFQVKGLPHLYVADTSIHPRSTGVNPQLTCMALASIFAERFAARVTPGRDAISTEVMPASPPLRLTNYGGTESHSVAAFHEPRSLAALTDLVRGSTGPLTLRCGGNAFHTQALGATIVMLSELEHEIIVRVDEPIDPLDGWTHHTLEVTGWTPWSCILAATLRTERPGNWTAESPWGVPSPTARREHAGDEDRRLSGKCHWEGELAGRDLRLHPYMVVTSGRVSPGGSVSADGTTRLSSTFGKEADAILWLDLLRSNGDTVRLVAPQWNLYSRFAARGDARYASDAATNDRWFGAVVGGQGLAGIIVRVKYLLLDLGETPLAGFTQADLPITPGDAHRYRLPDLIRDGLGCVDLGRRLEEIARPVLSVTDRDASLPHRVVTWMETTASHDELFNRLRAHYARTLSRSSSRPPAKASRDTMPCFGIYYPNRVTVDDDGAREETRYHGVLVALGYANNSDKALDHLEEFGPWRRDNIERNTELAGALPTFARCVELFAFSHYFRECADNGPYANDLFDAAFVMEGHSRAIGHHAERPMRHARLMQQSWLLPFEPARPESGRALLAEFMARLTELCAHAEVGNVHPQLCDIKVVGRSRSILGSTPDGPAFMVTITVESVMNYDAERARRGDGSHWGDPRQLFERLTQAFALRGVRIHLTKNLYASRGDLRRMYHAAAKEFLAVKRQLDPDGRFGSAFLVLLEDLARERVP